MGKLFKISSNIIQFSDGLQFIVLLPERYSICTIFIYVLFKINPSFFYHSIIFFTPVKHKYKKRKIKKTTKNHLLGPCIQER